MSINDRKLYDLRHLCLTCDQYSALQELTRSRPSVREKYEQLVRIIYDLTVPGFTATQRHAVALIVGKTLLDREADLTPDLIVRVILSLRACDPRGAAKLAELLQGTSEALRRYYYLRECNDPIEIMIYPNSPRAHFRDRTTNIYMPNLVSGNPSPDQPALYVELLDLCERLPDMVAEHLQSYSGIRVSRSETGARNGPLFHLPGHLAILPGEMLRADITLYNLRDRSVMTHGHYSGPRAAPDLLAKRIADALVRDLRPYVEIAIVPLGQRGP